MKKLIFTLVSLLLLVACNDTKAPQVVYDNETSDTLTIDNILGDTTKVLVAGMPVYLDSTGVEQLIHPIGWDDVYATYGKRYGSTFSGSDYINRKMTRGKEDLSHYGFEVQTDGRDYLSGEMVKLIFENAETHKQQILTDKILVIRNVKYLRNLAKKIDKHYLLYTVFDKDYNRDGKLDHLDMTAYYMSNLDGTNFSKITNDYHYFDVSELVLKNGRYYFRTLEDVNKDGMFNKKDKYHYYYIDLKNGDFTPIEYFPLDLIQVNN